MSKPLSIKKSFVFVSPVYSNGIPLNVIEVGTSQLSIVKYVSLNFLCLIDERLKKSR